LPESAKDSDLFVSELLWSHHGGLQGWDKTYSLQFVEKDFDTIHFFGDKTFKVS
jgi:Eukaryotic phosphomannomutase